MSIDIKKIKNARGMAGIYFLFENENLVYIGQSSDVYVRLLEHLAENEKKFTSFELCGVNKNQQDEFLFQLFELCSISVYKPKYNKLVVKDLWEWYNILPQKFKDNITLYGFNGYEDLKEIGKRLVKVAIERNKNGVMK